MDVQNAAIEIKELLQQVMALDPTNVVHTAQMTRLGELHLNKAKSFNAKMKAEVAKAKRHHMSLSVPPHADHHYVREHRDLIGFP